MSRPRRALGAAALAVALAVGSVGCGIPTDGEPRPLADEVATTASEGADPDGIDPTAVVYLVRANNQLERQTRALDGPRSVQTVLDALLLPPSEAEGEQGLDSYIPQDVSATNVETTDGTAVIDMSIEWRTLADPTGTTAYAQVVLTLTEIPGVDGVRFLIEGEETTAPTVNDGQQDVVTADDYAEFEPE